MGNRGGTVFARPLHAAASHLANSLGDRAGDHPRTRQLLGAVGPNGFVWRRKVDIAYNFRIYNRVVRFTGVTSRKPRARTVPGGALNAGGVTWSAVIRPA